MKYINIFHIFHIFFLLSYLILALKSTVLFIVSIIRLLFYSIVEKLNLVESEQKINPYSSEKFVFE